jgi:hypothetical protein
MTDKYQKYKDNKAKQQNKILDSYKENNLTNNIVYLCFVY